MEKLKETETTAKKTAAKRTKPKETVEQKIRKLRLELMIEASKPIVKKKTKEKNFVIGSEFDGKEEQVKILVQRIFDSCGKKITVVTEKESKPAYRINMVVVPLKCINDHDYKIGEPCMVSNISAKSNGTVICMKKDGTEGNYLQQFTPDAIRLATREEIVKFNNELPIATFSLRS